MIGGLISERMPFATAHANGYRLVSAASSWWSSLSPAFSTVNWPTGIGLERDFTFLSAVSADCLVHLSVFSIRQSVCTSVS